MDPNNQKEQHDALQTRYGVVHSLLLRDVRRWLDEKAGTNARLHLFDVRNYVEQKVLSVLKNKSGNRYNNVYNALAFPVGVNKNDVAAHYSPRDWEDAYLDLKHDSVSVDFGLFEPSLGLITDGAFTWNGSEDYVGTQLTKIAENAVDTIIQESKPDAILGEIGAVCQEYIGSQEVVIEGKEEKMVVKTLKDLCGHKIAPYVIHAGKAVPSISLPQYTQRMLDGETYAIEVFPTTGSGESYEVPVEKEVPTHVSLNPDVIRRLQSAPRPYIPKLVNIVTTRKCVPFHPDWYQMEDDLIIGGIKDEMWKAYPTIKTKDGAPVAQWEKMIRITEGGNRLLLKA